jgi:hypothetical protein
MVGKTLKPSTKTCHHFSIEKLWFHVKYNHCFSIKTWWQAPKGTFGYIRVPTLTKAEPLFSIKELRYVIMMMMMMMMMATTNMIMMMMMVMMMLMMIMMMLVMTMMMMMVTMMMMI